MSTDLSAEHDLLLAKSVEVWEYSIVSFTHPMSHIFDVLLTISGDEELQQGPKTPLYLGIDR